MRAGGVSVGRTSFKTQCRVVSVAPCAAAAEGDGAASAYAGERQAPSSQTRRRALSNVEGWGLLALADEGTG
ncbi:MAG: hypothetical protein CSA66_04385 [Proteobacteria bacterium]|nr:MAG: hypothetical protein CSA66_04385 [Pseudomonadota bacterium]